MRGGCLLAHIKLDQLVSRRPVEQVRGLGIWAGVVDREAMLMLKGSANVHVNRVTAAWVCFHYWVSILMSWRGQGDLPVCTYMSPGSTICGCCWRQCLLMALCVASHVSVLCACVSGTRAQPCCWLNLQTEKQQLRPSAWDRDFQASGQPRLGSSSQEGGTPIPRAAGGAAP